MESSEGGPQGGIPLGKHLTGQARLIGSIAFSVSCLSRRAGERQKHPENPVDPV
jgi:hypothetical protein